MANKGVPCPTRGFASMPTWRQREIASMGGIAAHKKGTAYEWTSEKAREAGRKGGMAGHHRRRLMGEEPPAFTDDIATRAAAERGEGEDSGVDMPPEGNGQAALDEEIGVLFSDNGPLSGRRT